MTLFCVYMCQHDPCCYTRTWTTSTEPAQMCWAQMIWLQVRGTNSAVLLVERENESFLLPPFLPNEWAEKLGELPTSLKEETSQMLVSIPASPLLVLWVKADPIGSGSIFIFDGHFSVERLWALPLLLRMSQKAVAEEPDLCRKMASKQVGMNWWGGGQDETISPISQIKHLFPFFLASHGPLVQRGAMVGECLSHSVSANAPQDARHDLSPGGVSNARRNQKGYEGPWETFLWDFLQSWGNSKSYSDVEGRGGELLGLFCNEPEVWACLWQKAAHCSALMINSPE